MCFLITFCAYVKIIANNSFFHNKHINMLMSHELLKNTYYYILFATSYVAFVINLPSKYK